MRVIWVRLGAVLFFVLFAVAVTWPGMVPFNRIEPLILGLPLSMTWIASWVLLSFLFLVLVDYVETAHGAGPEPEEEGEKGVDA